MHIPWVNLIWECYYQNNRLPNHVRKGSFWWCALLNLWLHLKGLALVTIQDGKSCSLWEDLRYDRVLKFSYPELFSFSKHLTISFKKAKEAPYLHTLFNLLLSTVDF